MAFALQSFFPAPIYPPAKPLLKNKYLFVLLAIFTGFYLYTGYTTGNFINWFLENTITVAAVGVIIFLYHKFPLSNTSYTLILLFMLLHLYGSQHAYAENPFGNWLKETFHLQRNHYDRIVHFSFGFLLVYPIQETVYYFFKPRSWLAYFIPLELTLSVSALYEIIEWLLADVFFPTIGKAFIGAQGDMWDSQKDVFMAVVGAFITLSFLLIRRNLKRNA